MDTETILAVAGISVSLAFGAWGVYLALRRRYPGKISFVSEQAVNLYAPSNHQLPGLEIKYNGEEVEKNLVLLNAALVNSGNSDISLPDIRKPISLKLPEGSVWRDALIVSCSKDMEPSISTNEQTIEINPGHMRKREYIRFQAIAEVQAEEDQESTTFKKTTSLDELITFDHRILNTARIDKLNYSHRLSDKKRFKKRFLLVSTMLAVVLALFVHLFWIGTPKMFAYGIKGTTGDVAYYSGKIDSDGIISLREVDGSDELDLPASELFDKFEKPPIVIENKMIKKTLFSLAAVYAFPPFALLLAMTFYYRKHKRLSEIFQDA